jgi:hypothetical protein
MISLRVTKKSNDYFAARYRSLKKVAGYLATRYWAIIFSNKTKGQGCGSGSGRIRNYLHVRIRNLIPDPSAVVFQHTVR